MTVETIAPRAGRRGLLASATAWVWPQPRQSKDRRAGGVWMGALASLWPSRVGDAGHDRRRGLMAVLFGWMWPAGLDRSLRRWWRASWLWSWIWPGRVMGPHGEICPLAPWHPVVSPGAGRRGRILAMIAAFAVAAPTFMVSDNVPDGGRLNLFRSGGTAQDGGAPAGGGGQTTDAGLGDAGGGAGGDGTGGDSGPTGDFAPTPDGPDGLVGGDGTGQPGPPDVDGDPGLTVIDLPPGLGDDLAPESGLSPFIGGGGGGGSGGAGGGGGGGGGQPTDPPGGDDPPTPPGETPPGVNPPAVDPPGPFLPTPPNVPGGGSNPPGTIKPPNQFNPDPPFIEEPRGPGGGDPIDNTGPRDNEPIGAVPEPGTWALMILGFGGVGYAIRRRRFAISVG